MPFQKGQSGNKHGRPRKAEKFARPIARAEKQIVDKLPTLLARMLELADGVTVQEVEKDGVRIYTRAPDRAALEYLVNRVMGKPTERQELTGANGGLLALAREVIIEVPADESVDTTDPDDL
jgi:hypothetical protein